jgi:SHS2 domain-containing protein
MRPGFRFVDHTADVEFIASGSSIEEAFANSFMALFDTICYTKRLKLQKTRTEKLTIRERAPDLERLLWYVLQDAVSIMDSRALFGYKIGKIAIKGKPGHYTFSAEISAKGQSPENAKLDVKGISIYNLKIGKKSNNFTANVVMDV